MRSKPNKPRRWIYPAAQEHEYEKALRALAADVERVVRENLFPVLQMNLDGVEDQPESAGWYELLRRGFMAAAVSVSTVPYARRAADLMRAVEKFNKRQFHLIMRKAYGVDIYVSEPWLADSLKIWESENISLIKSIPDQALTRMRGKIVSAVRAGQHPRSLIKEMTEEFGVTRRRAELIARDQIGKLNGQLTEERQTQIGVEEYKWRGVLDSREREAHVSREGETFQWSEPPEDGHPGEPVQCRCWAEPVLPLLKDLKGLTVYKEAA